MSLKLIKHGKSVNVYENAGDMRIVIEFYLPIHLLAVDLCYASIDKSVYLSLGLLSCVGGSQILSCPRKRSKNSENSNGMSSWQ